MHNEGECGNVTYLPHKEVEKDQSITAKVRIVFDDSARLKGQPCLDDILYTGPCLNPELYNLFTIQSVSYRNYRRYRKSIFTSKC